MINANFNSPYNNIENFETKKEKKKKKIKEDEPIKKKIKGERKEETNKDKNKDTNKDTNDENIKEGFLGANPEPNVGSSKSPISIKKQGTNLIDFSKNIKNQLIDMKPSLYNFGINILINAAIVWVVWKIGSHVIYFNSLPRDLLKSMYPPGYSFLINVLKENTADPRCTANIQSNEGGKKIVVDYSEDQRNSMILKKTCCPELDHPIKEGTEVSVPCFPLGTSMDTVRNLNEVNHNYSVWDSEYEGCVLYGSWKAENESATAAVEAENKERKANEKKADMERKQSTDAAAAAAAKADAEAKKGQKGGNGGGINQMGEEERKGVVAALQGMAANLTDCGGKLTEGSLEVIAAGGEMVGMPGDWLRNVGGKTSAFTSQISGLIDGEPKQVGGGRNNLIVSKKKQKGGSVASIAAAAKRGAQGARDKAAAAGRSVVKAGNVAQHYRDYRQNKADYKADKEENLQEAANQIVNNCPTGEEQRCAAQAAALKGDWTHMNEQSAADLEAARAASQTNLEQIKETNKTNLEAKQTAADDQYKSRFDAISAETYRTLDPDEADAQATANLKARQFSDMIRNNPGMTPESMFRQMHKRDKNKYKLDLKRRKEFEKLQKVRLTKLQKQYEKTRANNIKQAKQEMKLAMKMEKKTAAWESKQKQKDAKKNIEMQRKIAKMKAKQNKALFKTSLSERAEEGKEATGEFLQGIKDAFTGFMTSSVNMMRYVFGCSFDQTGQGMGWLFGYQTLGSIMTRFGLGIKTSVSWIIYSCMVASGGNVIVAALVGVVGVLFGASLVNTLWFSSVPLMWALYEFNLGRVGMVILILAIFSGPLAMLLTWPLGLVFIFFAVYYIVFGLWIGSFGSKGKAFKDKLQNCTNIRASLRRLFLILTFFSAMNTLKPEVVFGMLICFLWYEYKNQIPSVSTSLENAEKKVDEMLAKTTEAEIAKLK